MKHISTMVQGIETCVCIYCKPLLQVNQDDVRYLNRFTERELEGLVKNEVYPPAITCAVLYSSPRDYERSSLESFDIKIAGTTKHQVTFPIKVYSAIGENKCMSM